MAEQGLCSASDLTVIDACRAEGRCLVTLDLDFSNPIRSHHPFGEPAKPGAAGLIVLRCEASTSRDPDLWH